MNLLKAETSKTLIEIKTYYPDHIVDVIIKYFLFLAFFLGFGTRNIGNDSFLIGYSFWIIASYIISEASVQLSYEKQIGTIEQLFIKPYSSSTILLVRSLLMFTVSLVKFALLAIVIFLTMRISVSLPLPVLVVFFASIFGFFGLGIFLSALTLIFTKTASFESVISYALLVLSGVIVPFGNIPSAVNKIMYSFPYFYGIGLAQKLRALQEVKILEWVFLFLLNFAAFALSLFFYELCLKYVRRRGMLNKY